jgi:hypothetical protein
VLYPVCRSTWRPGDFVGEVWTSVCCRELKLLDRWKFGGCGFVRESSERRLPDICETR